MQRTLLVAIVGSLLALAVVAPTAAASPARGGFPANTATTQPDALITPNWTDFNNDGYDDLTIGAPGDDVVRNGVRYAGAGVVNVIYGSAQGLVPAGGNGAPHSQVWSQDSPGVVDKAEAGDHFGWALAKGDFDGDGYADLAIGVPGEDLPGNHQGDPPIRDLGGVNILFGSANGLVARPAQGLLACCFINTAGRLPHTQFGYSLSALDYATPSAGTDVPDGVADLAVGMPGWHSNEGGVGQFSGSPINGGTGAGMLGFVDFGSFPGCRIGTSLARGAFDNDLSDDLAIGAPGCDTHNAGTQMHAGAVIVEYNGAGATGLTILKQDAGFYGVPESGDRLGTSVATADFNTDGHDDLMAGAPGEDMGGKADAGIVELASRSSDGTTWQLLGEVSRKTAVGANVAHAQFGASLATDYLDHSNSDVVIGSPGDTVSGRSGAGVVWVFVSGTIGGKAWTQNSAGVLDQAETGDGFGSTVAIGDFDGNNGGDLVIGVPHEDLPGKLDAGAVSVLYATSKMSPPAAANNDFWTQDSPNVGEVAQRGDRFGTAAR